MFTLIWLEKIPRVLLRNLIEIKIFQKDMLVSKQIIMCRRGSEMMAARQEDQMIEVCVCFLFHSLQNEALGWRACDW